MNNNYLTVEELAEHFRISPYTLRMWLSNARKVGIELPRFVRLAKRKYYEESEFKHWIFQNAQKIKQSFPQISTEDEREFASRNDERQNDHAPSV